MRRLTSDPDATVSANAFFNLGLLKDSASVQVAVTALSGPSEIGIEAAWLLGELAEVGRPGIVAGLADASVSSATRGALLLAATRLRPLPTAAIVPLLASGDSAIAWRAAYAVARGRGLAGVRTLLGLDRSPWSSVRDQVARAAARNMVGDSLASVARAALERLIADTSARVRMTAIRSLATFGAPYKAAVLAALRDSDKGVSLSAAQSLDLVLDSTAAMWTQAFEADTNFAVQRAVADGAIRRGVNLAQQGKWRESTDWQRRAAAAELDARGPASAAVTRLSTWMADAEGRVRAAAAGGLARLSDSTSVRAPVRAALRSFLSDADIGVRSASLGGLTRGASADEFADALASYRDHTNDVDADARLAFWRLADSAVARNKTLPASVEAAFNSLPRPTEAIERNAAARIPRFASWRDSTGTARPSSWYDDRAREAGAPQPVLTIETERGVLELALFSGEAPVTVHNIRSLAARQYFDGQRFHRVVPNFVVQGGDPRGDGSGGPGYAIRDEINRHRYGRGTLGMALSGPNTGGSQFFVTHSPQPHLDGGYTVFGQLLRGGDVLDRIIQGDRIVRVTVR